MTIINAFQDLFYSTYNGKNIDRDFEIILSRYFPSDSKQATISVYRALSLLPNVNISQESCNNVDDVFKRAIFYVRASEGEKQELVLFKKEIGKAYDAIKKFNNFISLQSLQSNLEEDRSLAGIFILGAMVGFPENTKIVSLYGSGYIVPNEITRKQLEESVAVARKQATHYGSVFPYHRLISMPEWEFIPSVRRKGFARELLCNIDGFLELGNEELFGFSNIAKDRIVSRLIRIFSVYKEVPAEILVKALQRTMKSRVDERDILEECTDVFDEYCVRIGYCMEREGYLLSASPVLRTLIEQEQPESENSMFGIEKKLVSALRKNRAPMNTKDFMPIMTKNHANKANVMEFAMLIYREGWRNNSVYHTLDDIYAEVDLEAEVNPGVDRTRIEINRINRNIRLSRKIKRLCKNKCQICGERIQVGEESFYSEVHHIRPIGRPHNGDDREENMLCVCPNDHVMLDYGVIVLDISKILFFDLHPVEKQFVDYYNKNIFRAGQ